MAESLKNLTPPNAGKQAEKLDPLHIAGKNVIKHSHPRKQFGDFLKKNNRSVQKPLNLPIVHLGFIPEK